MSNSSSSSSSSSSSAVDDSAGGGLWKYLRGILSGTCSGITKLIVGHPFDTIKVRLQVDNTKRFGGPLDCLKQTINKEGLIRGLYKGYQPPLVGWTIIDSVLWGSLIQYRTILQSSNPNNSPLSLTQHAVAGMLAGWTSVIVVTPIEQVKARLQVQYGTAIQSFIFSLLL
jgi:solute carrier family 25 carnitine/acylcarnitine transporter 20/29